MRLLQIVPKRTKHFPTPNLYGSSLQVDHYPYNDEDEPLDAAGDASRALVPLTRHDGFTPKRRRKFLKTLRKTGCVRDACRRAEISDSAAYKARRRDPEFRALWASALSRAGGELEILAWQRAVEGIEEDIVAYGKVVGTRRRYDEQLFRMMLKASNPGKYGGQGVGSRKELEKKIRAEIEQEQLAGTMAYGEDREDVTNRILRKIAGLRRRQIASGAYYEGENGALIPTGYVKVAPEAGADFDGGERPDSGADWTDPEPLSGPFDSARDAEMHEETAENRRSGPRITSLGGP